MVRADPGDPFDGVGWSALRMDAGAKVENQYMMWRKDIFASSAVDSGCGDNHNQALHSRLADVEGTSSGGSR
jgi:hypothetical protein